MISMATTRDPTEYLEVSVLFVIFGVVLLFLDFEFGFIKKLNFFTIFSILCFLLAAFSFIIWLIRRNQ